MNALTIPLEEHTREVSALNEQIKNLEEQLAWFKKQVFGPKAEKFVDLNNSEQLYFEGLSPSPVEDEPKKEPIAAGKRKKRKPTGKDKISFPDDLPVETQVIDIPEEDKVCKETGKALAKIGEEKTSKLAHRPGSYYIKEIIRPKYALPQESDGGILTADLPETLLPRCQADESLLAEILVKKFADHLPLYRQSEIMAREGIFISRQTLCKWVLRAGIALKPLYDEMLAHTLSSQNIFYDETPIDMLSPGKGKVHRAYMWVIVGGKSANPAYRIYDFRTNRCHDNAANMLQGYTGVLHSDKYGAYEALANQKKLIWCPCWGHIRRNFIEAKERRPSLSRMGPKKNKIPFYV